jgi:4-aminobutyrate---pyruvate transaminase
MIIRAKALSAAMQPISALLVNERIYQAMLAESKKLGNFAHRYTYWAHPVAAAVALEVQRIYAEMDLIGHVQRVGGRMQRALARLADHPRVGDVRGAGLLAGLDIVTDKQTRAMFDPALQVPTMIERNLKKNALILRVIGNRIALSPPVIITASEVDELVQRLSNALDHTLGELETG